MRLIDADKLYPDRMTTKGGVAISQSQIANAPTVEPEREKGKWIRRKYTDAFKCSVCGCTPDYDDMVSTDDICVYRYCRWCGAKMEVDG